MTYFLNQKQNFLHFKVLTFFHSPDAVHMLGGLHPVTLSANSTGNLLLFFLFRCWISFILKGYSWDNLCLKMFILNDLTKQTNISCVKAHHFALRIYLGVFYRILHSGKASQLSWSVAKFFYKFKVIPCLPKKECWIWTGKCALSSVHRFSPVDSAHQCQWYSDSLGSDISCWPREPLCAKGGYN